MQLTLTLALDVLRGRFDEGVSDMFSAMCAWVLFANLQANLSPFRCIPHYVTQRDVERNNCSLEPVGYRHFPRPYVSTRGCGYARLINWWWLWKGTSPFSLKGDLLSNTNIA